MDDASISSRDTSTTTNTTSTTDTNRFPQLNEHVHLNEWKNDNKMRYVLPNLIQGIDRNDRKKENNVISMSDAVVWNVYYLTTNTNLPSMSPTVDQKTKAWMFVRKLKTALNAVFVEETQQLYWMNANQNQWAGLRGQGDKFTNFRNLLQRTKQITNELVRFKVMFLNDSILFSNDLF